jgi:hypothetical protein
MTTPTLTPFAAPRGGASVPSGGRAALTMTRSARLLPVCAALVCATSWGPSWADTVDARFPRQERHADSVFTRMFPELPAFAAQADRVRNAAALLGAKDGPLDARDNLTDPVQSVVNQPVFSPNNRDSTTMTAGMTFIGQFLDHDITFDRRSALNSNADPARTRNFRSAAFDLDSVYGEGPERSAELYDLARGDYRLRVDPIPGSPAVSRKGAQRWDLPRDAGGEALVGDSRNDENVILSQFHVAMLRFHNAVVDMLRAQPRWQGATARQVFEEARRIVTWHYQWIIMHEFLPLTIGQERVDRLLRERDGFYRADARRDSGGNPLLPIEFSVAAYRFGHSQIRPSYRLNFGPDNGPQFFGFIFDDALDPNGPDPGDFRGGRRAARRFVDWQTFFDFGDGNVRPNKLIDAKLSTPLMLLPGSLAPSPGLPTDGMQSLASRNLVRHVNFGLPSGQAIAARLRVQALTPAQLAELRPYRMDESTPLWYYVLKEAEVLEGGLRLGPVGARIVGEVFIELLRADRDSYLSDNPRWRPHLPSAGGPGTFRITDLLKFAGVVPPLQ